MTGTPILVMCHTVLNDALRSDYAPEHQESAKFLIRYLIEKQVSLSDGHYQSVTSQQVMESIYDKLPNQGHPDFPAKILLILKNLILDLDTSPVKNINESVIIISDVLSSSSDEVVLVSNMEKKIRLVVDFYQKSEKTSKRWKPKNIPFRILNTTQVVEQLRKIDTKLCDLVDKRLSK